MNCTISTIYLGEPLFCYVMLLSAWAVLVLALVIFVVCLLYRLSKVDIYGKKIYLSLLYSLIAEAEVHLCFVTVDWCLCLLTVPVPVPVPVTMTVPSLSYI